MEAVTETGVIEEAKYFHCPCAEPMDTGIVGPMRPGEIDRCCQLLHHPQLLALHIYILRQ